MSPFKPQAAENTFAGEEHELAVPGKEPPRYY